MKKFHNNYKYDIAMIIPIYKIGKEKIKNYIEEIKHAFDGFSYQIVLSDNRPLTNRDCDLADFDDDVVSHIDNGGNVYAFRARMSGFSITDAYYIWNLDDDNDMVTLNHLRILYYKIRYSLDQTVNKELKVSEILETLLPRNETIAIMESIAPGLGSLWCTSYNVKKFYDTIGNKRLPTTYFEDTLAGYFFTKDTPIYYTDLLLYIYIPESDAWNFSDDYYNGDSTPVNIDHFISGIESMIDFNEPEIYYFNILLIIRFFKFTNEDIYKITHHSREINNFLINLINFCNNHKKDYYTNILYFTFSNNLKRIEHSLNEIKTGRKQRSLLRMIKGLPHAIALANVVTDKEKILCLDNDSYNFFKDINLPNDIIKCDEFLNPYHSKIKYLLHESSNNPNVEILFMDAYIQFRDKKFTKLKYDMFDGMLCPTYEQVFNGTIKEEKANMPIAKIMIANHCTDQMLNDYIERASQKRTYRNTIYHYYNNNCKGYGLEEQVLYDIPYCKSGGENWKYNLRLFKNVLCNHSMLYDNIVEDNNKLHLKYFDYLKLHFKLSKEEIINNSSIDIYTFWQQHPDFWEKGQDVIDEYIRQKQADGTIIT